MELNPLDFAQICSLSQDISLVGTPNFDGVSEGIEVNSSTIYRFLNKLSTSGEVMKYVARKGEMSSFQYIGGGVEHNCKEHLHLHCVKCGRIIHLDCGFMNEIKGHIMEHHGFELQCESSVLYGVCSECRKDSE